jgi:SOS response regulatory protein OraA/RecX
MDSPPESRGSAETPPDPFDEHKGDIQAMINDYTTKEIVQELSQRGFLTSQRSLERRLKIWGFRRQPGASGTNTPVSEALIKAVDDLFHHTLLDDSQIAARVLKQGLHTTGRQVRSIRQRSGWRRRITSGPDQAAHAAATFQQVEQVLNGPGRIFGRRWMITYLRQHCGFIAHQNDVATAQRQLDPEGVAARQPGCRKKRLENYITSGPNFLWCLDGHDKLAQFGMQIYAAIDAYSRKIIWYYCGSSNRTAISVVRQYLTAVKSLGLCPRFIRTDRGTETVLLTTIHFSLFIEACLAEQWPEDEYQVLQISDCYIYGKSTQNIRIEGLWRQQRFQCTDPWIDYFKILQVQGLYRPDLLADQVVVLFLFMPLLRKELTAFVNTHNAHPIRAQKNRSQHVPGVPDELYQHRQYGFEANDEVLTALQATLPEHGRYYLIDPRWS